MRIITNNNFLTAIRNAVYKTLIAPLQFVFVCFHVLSRFLNDTALRKQQWRGIILKSLDAALL